MRFPLEKTVKWLGIALLAVKLAFLILVIFFFDNFIIFFAQHSDSLQIIIEQHPENDIFSKIYFSTAWEKQDRQEQSWDSIYPDSDTTEIFHLSYDFLRVKPLPGNFPGVRLQRMGREEILAGGSLGNRKANLSCHAGDPVWVNVSNDGGKTWNTFFTGLYPKHSYELVADENLPLWKNDSTLQIRIRINKHVEHHLPPPQISETHQMISDRFVAELDLNKLKRDSDDDGLTDVQEMRYMTDPYLKDTDSDGIPDDKDLNPRYAGSLDPKSLLYSALLEDRIRIGRGGQPVIVSDEALKPGEPVTGNFLTPATLLITDEPELQRIIPCNSTGMLRYIIMSSEEYRQYRKKLPNDFGGFNDRDISPFYPADHFPDAYWATVSGRSYSWDYFIKRTRHGWKVFDMGGIII
jgi:hypothetical protein